MCFHMYHHRMYRYFLAHHQLSSHSLCLSLLKVIRWLGPLLWEEPSCTVFRAKGILSIEGQANKFVLQCVGDLFDVQVPSVLKYYRVLCVF